MTTEKVGDFDVVFRLDTRSGVPTYLQLVHQVERAIQLGFLRKGDQLPKVKDAVAALSINPNTVLKAYRDLERKGLIASRPGVGTFVTSAPKTVDIEVLNSLRRRLAGGWLNDAREAGLDEDGVQTLMMMALRDVYGTDGSAVVVGGAQGAA